MSFKQDYSIAQFYALVQEAGLARDMQLRVTGFVVNGINNVLPEDLIFVRTAGLPGKTNNTQEVSFMGTKLQIPGTVSFENPWAINFYCTQDYNMRKLLEASMTDTYDPLNSTGDMEPRDLETYRIDLSVLDDQMAAVRTYTLYGAYVNSIDPINYDATGTGAVQQVGATISYQYWDVKDSSGQTPAAKLKRPGSVNKYTNLQTILGI